MNFSSRVKQVREQLKMNQTAFAKALGVSRSTLLRWENGEYKPNYDAMQKFEEFCKTKNITLKGD